MLLEGTPQMRNSVAVALKWKRAGLWGGCYQCKQFAWNWSLENMGLVSTWKDKNVVFKLQPQQNSGNSAVKRENKQVCPHGKLPNKNNKSWCKNWRVKTCLIVNCPKYIHWRVRRGLLEELILGNSGLTLPDREGRQHFRSASFNGHWLKLVMIKFSCCIDKSAVEMSISRKDRNRWITFEKAEGETQSITAAKAWYRSLQDTVSVQGTFRWKMKWLH